jgi:KipI family sensor histidine kinase inhibitor
MKRVGELAYLLELSVPGAPIAAYRRLAAASLPGVVDLVPGARTLLVVLTDEKAVDESILREAEVAADVEARDDLAPAGRPLRRHEIAVRYAGEDLDAVAGRTGMSRAQVIALHASVDYRVAFLGFQPGFAYLSGLPAALHLPRLASPRPHVPAGSVAIAGDWSGIYPAKTPGGWNLIGSTDASLFAADHDPPALFAPGDVVRFVVD